MEITKTSYIPIKKWTLEEIKKWCENYWSEHPCITCPLNQICGNKVKEWDFTKPRLASLIGVEVGQKFHLGMLEEPKYFINSFGDLRCANDPDHYADCSVLCSIIQDPSCIHID